MLAIHFLISTSKVVFWARCEGFSSLSIRFLVENYFQRVDLKRCKTVAPGQSHSYEQLFSLNSNRPDLLTRAPQPIGKYELMHLVCKHLVV